MEHDGSRNEYYLKNPGEFVYSYDADNETDESQENDCSNDVNDDVDVDYNENADSVNDYNVK
jgi:hypothetical protein